MKIARVTFSYNRHSGIFRGVTEVVERLAKEHEVHVFANSWDDVISDRIVFHKVPAWTNRWSLRRFCFFISSGIMLRCHDFDIVHLHHASAYPCDVVTCHGLARAGMHAIHNMGESCHMDFDPKRIRRYQCILRLLEHNYKIGRRKKIIAISQSVKKDLLRFCGVPKQDVIVIHNGVNLNEFNPAHRTIHRAVIRNRFNLEDNDFVFLFVGHFFKRKGLKVVLKALSKIPDKNVKLFVVGNDSVDQDSFIRLTVDMGLKARVIFVGHVSHANYYYAASDAFTFPTLYEPFGLTILEAMASGLPVITSASAGAAELIVDNVNGILLDDPTNESQLTQKMELFIDNSELRRTLGKEARNTAEKCSWDAVADETLKLYGDLLSNN